MTMPIFAVWSFLFACDGFKVLYIALNETDSIYIEMGLTTGSIEVTA